MKTAFTVVAEELPPRNEWNVATHGWSTGTSKWHPTEEDARADAAKKSKRKVRPAKHIEPYQYPYSVTHFPSGGGHNTVAIYWQGEEEPPENFDGRGYHKSNPDYRGDQ